MKNSSAVDYAPRLINDGHKGIIFAINKAIRIINEKFDVSTPNVIISYLKTLCFKILFSLAKS